MDSMQISMAESNSTSPSIPSTLIATSATVPPAQPPSSKPNQLSPGQKRSANEDNTPSTTPAFDQAAPNPSLNPTPIYADDKENGGNSLGLKHGHGTLNNPTLAGSATTTTEASLAVPATNMGQAQSQAGTPPAKKRKLSPAEKEAKQQEKEAKERQKIEEKARKDEERAKKEEEKRKRDAEKEEERKKREEKKRAKDEEKAAREEEKRKKDEEKLKKERAQMKLNSFFAKPKVPTEQSSTVGGSPKKLSGDGISAGSFKSAREVSDYQREFPNFFLHANTTLAPPHRFERDALALAHLQEKVDASFNIETAEQLTFRPSELFKLMPYKRRRGQQKMSVRDILFQMQSLSDLPETSDAARRLQESLKQVRMKSLKFGEDVRPPYQGTYTKNLSREAASKLMRNPFRRELPEVNYDYDSEAEWEDAEEGEELDSEEEEEGSEDGDEDMDGFLDDEDDHLANGKRRLLVGGDLEPVCSGIKWQDQGLDPELQAYKLETILPSVTFPIDPFSSSNWCKPTKAPEPGMTNVNGLGQRPTWNYYTVNPVSRNSAFVAMQSGKRAPGNPKRDFPPDQLGEFKTVVEGSDLTKTGLIEVLKKRFPKVSKNTLKDTLDSVATRIGQKEADKKWVCR
ncbi:putative chromatin assembly factor 1 subunit A [Aspergillus mulundensis]|uniref:Chromatin assembly factor 1 subunit A n=1 Tax=Aspergillus mulundensis TaxID=1810919 RepID=A0A3D8T3L6_9EURO|nr:hypothetical protein DSM5745_00466 [Aspergillus mulundensis]RDW93144.1 hypothetical protein DSM5745_00466 [Aspergillus mulundensis]